MQPKLKRAINQAIKDLTTTEEVYFSASKLGVTPEVAEEIIADWLIQITCEANLSEITQQRLDAIWVGNFMNMEIEDDSGI